MKIQHTPPLGKVVHYRVPLVPPGAVTCSMLVHQIPLFLWQQRDVWVWLYAPSRVVRVFPGADLWT